jgi:hypothetical protein
MECLSWQQGQLLRHMCKVDSRPAATPVLKISARLMTAATCYPASILQQALLLLLSAARTCSAVKSSRGKHTTAYALQQALLLLLWNHAHLLCSEKLMQQAHYIPNTACACIAPALQREAHAVSAHGDAIRHADGVEAVANHASLHLQARRQQQKAAVVQLCTGITAANSSMQEAAYWVTGPRTEQLAVQQHTRCNMHNDWMMMTICALCWLRQWVVM